MLRRARMPEGRLKKLLLRRHAGLVRSAHEDIKTPCGVIRIPVDAILIISYIVRALRSRIAGMNQRGMSDVEVGVDRVPVEICRPHCSKLPELAGEIFVRFGFQLQVSTQAGDV